MADVFDVRNFFGDHHIILNNVWETEVLRYIKLNAAKTNPGAEFNVSELVYDQWLHSDLSESTFSQLKVPPNARKLTLAKPAVVQICAISDVSDSAYSQYRSQVIDMSQDDADFCDPTELTAVDRVSSKSFDSVLVLDVSDGQTTLKATVTKQIPGIGITTLPGTKLLLIPRIVCRRRCFILTAQNCQILGGSCERLINESYPTMKLLCRRLNLDYKTALDKIQKLNLCLRQTVIGKPKIPKHPPPPPKPIVPSTMVHSFPPPPPPALKPIAGPMIDSFPPPPPTVPKPIAAPSFPPSISTYGYDHEDSGFDDGFQQTNTDNSRTSESVSSFFADDPDESFVEPPVLPNYALLRRSIGQAPTAVSKVPLSSVPSSKSSDSTVESQPERLLSLFSKKKKPKSTTKSEIHSKSDSGADSQTSVSSLRDNDGFLKPKLPNRWKSNKTLVATECVPETPFNVVRKIKSSEPSLQSVGPMDKFLKKLPQEPIMVIPPTPDVGNVEKVKCKQGAFAYPQPMQYKPPTKVQFEAQKESQPCVKSSLTSVPTRSVCLPESSQKVSRIDAPLKSNYSKALLRDSPIEDGGFDVSEEPCFSNNQETVPKGSMESALLQPNFDFNTSMYTKTQPMSTQEMISNNVTMDTTFDYNMTQPDITMATPLSPLGPLPEDPSLYIPRSIVPQKVQQPETPMPHQSVNNNDVTNVSLHTPDKKPLIPPKTPMRTKMVTKLNDSPLSNDDSTSSSERVPSPNASQLRGIKRVVPDSFSPPPANTQKHVAQLLPKKRELNNDDEVAVSSWRSPSNPKRRLDFANLHVSPREPTESSVKFVESSAKISAETSFFSPVEDTCLPFESGTTMSFTQVTTVNNEDAEMTAVERYKSLGIKLLAEIFEERKSWSTCETRIIQPLSCDPSNNLTVRNGLWVFKICVSDTSAANVQMVVDSAVVDKLLGCTADYIKKLRTENKSEYERCKNRGQAMTKAFGERLDLIFYVLFPHSGSHFPIVKKVTCISKVLGFV